MTTEDDDTQNPKAYLQKADKQWHSIFQVNAVARWQYISKKHKGYMVAETLGPDTLL